jgi:hypothetical protein
MWSRYNKTMIHGDGRDQPSKVSKTAQRTDPSQLASHVVALPTSTLGEEGGAGWRGWVDEWPARGQPWMMVSCNGLLVVSSLRVILKD